MNSDIRVLPEAVPVEYYDELPTSFELLQNYPNPINPSTKIVLRIRDYGLVTLRVYNVLGREVATLAGEVMSPGMYERVFDAGGLASGVYVCRLQAGPYSQSRRLMLLR